MEMHLHHLIKWPAANEIPALSEEFQQRAGFPVVIGAMDGTYINIRAPEENQKDYNNPSLLVFREVLMTLEYSDDRI
ncbi:hypothetical protein OUZ56_029888 [Daphnia magna]|uniref:DDE Tnp4 domain-containing protein n=1 Tax=Daphnia magna TaxID=35525 RepID=A0ABR0B8K6_9CRUS|nr:hypothetical protein OUZ56_029888 [Daphnia magna]